MPVKHVQHVEGTKSRISSGETSCISPTQPGGLSKVVKLERFPKLGTKKTIPESKRWHKIDSVQ